MQHIRHKAKTTKFSWDIAKNRADKEIQVGSNNKLKSFKFINFLSLIGKFSGCQWLTTVVLIEVDFVVDEKKKLQWLITYCKTTPAIATVITSADHPNLSPFHHYYVKLFWVTCNYDWNKTGCRH